MSAPPNRPLHGDPADGRDSRGSGRALPQGSAPEGDHGRRVVDAEVLHGDERDRQTGGAHGAGAGPGDSRGYGRNGAFRRSGFFYGGSGNGFTGGGMRFGQVWATNGAEQNACLAPCTTLALFLVCLAQFGFLAGIGFVFFHMIGSMAGMFWSMRRLSMGHMPNPWFWRLGNWACSFLLTVWLAGGFD